MFFSLLQILCNLEILINTHTHTSYTFHSLIFKCVLYFKQNETTTTKWLFFQYCNTFISNVSFVCISVFLCVWFIFTIYQFYIGVFSLLPFIHYVCFVFFLLFLFLVCFFVFLLLCYSKSYPMYFLFDEFLSFTHWLTQTFNHTNHFFCHWILSNDFFLLIASSSSLYTMISIRNLNFNPNHYPKSSLSIDKIR